MLNSQLPSRRRRLAAAVSVPVLVFGLAACGGDSDTAADEPSGESSSATSEAPAETESSEPAAEAPADGEEVDAQQFADDIKAGVEGMTTAKIAMKTSAAGATFDATGDIDYSTTPPSMSMTMTSAQMGDQSFDIRLVDGVMYMNMGQMSGGKFLKVDLDDPNSPLGDMSQLTDMMNPAASFEMFTAGLEKVVFVGEEDVQGESMRHYEITIDTTKIEMLQGAGADSGLPKTLPYDVWLDSDNRMRQMKMDMGELGSTEMTVSDLGEDVSIEAPPADQVTDAPEGMG